MLPSALSLDSMLTGMLYHLGLGREDAEELIQDSRMKLVRARNIRSPDAWLFRVTRNAGIRLVNAERRRQKQRLPMALIEQLPAPRPISAEARWARIETIRTCVERLPVHLSIVVSLRMEGKTQNEIARLLGCTPGIVRGRFRKACEHLRGQLEKLSCESGEDA